MQSAAVETLLPTASLDPITSQLTMPFTSRSFCITGSCEKSWRSMRVITCCSGASGFTLSGVLIAESKRPTLNAGSSEPPAMRTGWTMGSGTAAQGTPIDRSVAGTGARTSCVVFRRKPTDASRGTMSKSGTVSNPASSSRARTLCSTHTPRRSAPNQAIKVRTVTRPPSSPAFNRSRICSRGDFDRTSAMANPDLTASWP